MKISLNHSVNNTSSASKLQVSKTTTSLIDLLFSKSIPYLNENSITPVTVGKDKLQSIQPKLSERIIENNNRLKNILSLYIYKIILYIFNKKIHFVKSCNTLSNSIYSSENSTISNMEFRLLTTSKMIH